MNVYTKTANTNINRIAFVFSLLHANVAFTRVIRLPIGTSVTGNLPHHVKKNGNETILEEDNNKERKFNEKKYLCKGSSSCVIYYLKN